MEIKRTGLEACLIFFKLNGYRLSDAISNQLLTGFILAVASGDHTLETVQSWLKDHSIKNNCFRLINLNFIPVKTA